MLSPLFFYKYPLQGIKSKDFSDLSKEGLDRIRIIQNRMNTSRKE